VLAHHGGVHRGQLGTRRVERHPGRQAAEELRHPMAPAGDHRRPEVMRAGDDVRDDLGVGRIGDRRLEHPDHGGGARTEADGLADDGRVALERGGPEPVGEDRRARRVGAIVAGVQQAAEHGMQAHELRTPPLRRYCEFRAS
jgi:hypothetical protein